MHVINKGKSNAESDKVLRGILLNKNVNGWNWNIVQRAGCLKIDAAYEFCQELSILNPPRGPFLSIAKAELLYLFFKRSGVRVCEDM